MRESFDEYCDRMNIAPGDEPIAFAAWLNSQSGWDGEMISVPDERQAERLLAHIKAADTGWFRVSHALLTFGFHKVPEEEEPRNPIKRLAVRIGAWMDNRQTERLNERLDAEELPRQECEFSDECHEDGTIYLEPIHRWSCGLHALLYP